MSALFHPTKVDVKSTSDAVWWIKYPSRSGKQQQHQAPIGRKAGGSPTSLCHELADLIRNMSLHGYSQLLAPELVVWERLIWLAVHVTTFICLLMMLLWSWENFVAKYIVISLHDPQYPVENVPFPAVSICTNNRISRDAAILYANELRRKDPRNRTVDYFLNNIQSFINLYQKFAIGADYDEYKKFQYFLDNYDTLPNETFYNTKKNMWNLTPDCKSKVLHCTLAGIEIDCFSERAFASSLTMYGVCCTFNTNDSYRERSFRDRFVDSELGLTVFLNTSATDDFASILSSDSYIVLVHTPNEFPYVGSGSLQEIFPPRHEESFISIRARLGDTVDALRSFSPRRRQCYFDDEQTTREMLFKNEYTFSNCITACRIRSIMVLCRCLPFYMPLTLADNQNGVVYCNIGHLECLARYDFKWKNVLTYRDLQAGLERENEDALYCPHCLPACVDIQYQVSLMSQPIDRYETNAIIRRLRADSLTLKDVSVLRVHFRDPFAKYYRRMVGNSWFEAFCTVGNITSIILGFSIVAVFEIGYFLVRCLLVGTKAFLRENTKQKHKTAPAERGLYICP